MPGKQSEKSEKTRQRLIEAAQALFYKKGFDKTAVREIVEAAGVAQGTFYLYFETKDEVLFKILEQAFESFNGYINLLPVEDPSLEDIDFIIEASVAYMQKNPELIRLLHNANILEIMKLDKFGMVSDWFLMSVLEKWLTNAIKKRIIPYKSPDLYARILFQVAHDLLESAFLYQFPDKIDVVKHELIQLLKNILR